MLIHFLSSKMESLTSSLYSSYISLRADKLAHSHNNPKGMQYCNAYCYCRNNNNYYGLETLVHPEEENLPRRIVQCYNKASPATTTTPKPYSLPSLPPLSKLLWSPSSPALRSTVLGDLIGTESGDYMCSDVAEELVEVEATKVEGQSRSRIGREMRSERKRELLPPLSLMRETGRMHWSFKREYNEDGRLIIKAESVKRHEYVEAHRENCRLTMKLVHEDENTDWCEECEWSIDEEEEEGSDFELEFEEGLAKESSLEDESGRSSMDLRQCVSYAGTGTGGLIEDATAYLGRPGSAPLQPMTPVM